MVEEQEREPDKKFPKKQEQDKRQEPVFQMNKTRHNRLFVEEKARERGQKVQNCKKSWEQVQKPLESKNHQKVLPELARLLQNYMNFHRFPAGHKSQSLLGFQSLKLLAVSHFQ